MRSKGRFLKRSGSARNVIIALVTLVVAAVGVGIYLIPPADKSSRANLEDVPKVDRSKISTRVNDQLDQAYEGIEKFPEQGSSWGFLGQILFANGFEEEAAECFERAIELEPKNGRWPYLLGIYREQSDLEQAETLYRKSIELAGNPTDIKLRLANLMFENGRYEECKEILVDLRLHETRSARLEYLDARLAMREASELNEQEREPKLLEAVKFAETAADIDPKRPEIHALLAQIYFQLDDPRASAEAELGQAESYGWPDDFVDVMMSFRGDVRYRIFVAEQANMPVKGRINLLKEAVEEEPNVPGWHGRLANAYLEAGELTQAELAIANGVKKHPEAAELHYVSGLVAFFGSNFKKAEQAFEKAIEFKADYVEAYTNLGMAQRELGKNEPAIRSFREALRFDGTNLQAQFNLAFTLKEAGQAEQAITEFERTIELNPPVIEPYLDAAELYRSQGNQQRAIELLQQGLQLDPTNQQAIDLLDQLRNSNS